MPANSVVTTQLPAHQPKCNAPANIGNTPARCLARLRHLPQFVQIFFFRRDTRTRAPRAVMMIARLAALTTAVNPLFDPGVKVRPRDALRAHLIHHACHPPSKAGSRGVNIHQKPIVGLMKSVPKSSSRISCASTDACWNSTCTAEIRKPGRRERGP